MAKKLNFLEFRTAGFRNLNVCKELVTCLENCDSARKVNLLHKIFYLSGYVIEFSFKYILFNSLKLGKFENLYTYRDEAFRKKWQQHDFEKLRSLCTECKIHLNTDIPYLGTRIKDKELEALLKAWDVQIRYSLVLSHHAVVLEESRMRDLVRLIEEILTKVVTKYP